MIRNRRRISRILIGMCIGMLMIPGYSVQAMTPEEYAACVEEALETGKVHIVSKQEYGNFTSIQDAVDAAQSGDTIFIDHGVYEEALHITDKELNLIGLDKETCIIEYMADSYYHIPLNIAAGKVSNLTIIGKSFDATTEEQVKQYKSMSIEDRSTIQVDTMPGYAIHIESDYTFGKNLTFENCRIVSDENYAVGMGCRGNSTVTFESCELVAKDKAGCIYLHNSENPLMAGDTDVIFRNCTMKNYRCPYVMTLHSFQNTNRLFLTFQNVHISTVAFEKKSIYNGNNLFTGLNVDTLYDLEKKNGLEKHGFVTSMTENMVHKYDMEQSIEYLSALTEEEYELSEGITYLRMTEYDAETRALQKTPEVQKRIRSVIGIYNDNGVVGDGWCGLDGIYLTPESFGNTLIEMNYDSYR